MPSFVTNEGAESLLDGSINWGSDTIRARLVDSAVTPTKDTTAMTGMTGIGTDQTLGSKTRTKDTANDRIVYDAADPTWTAVAGGSTVGWVIVYKFDTDDAGSTPIFVIDVTNLPTNGSDIAWPISSDGIGYLQQ
jgi:hypothetical protein